MTRDATLASRECSNHTPEGGCLGTDFGRQWNTRFAGLEEREVCVLYESNPCDYFNKCVRGRTERRECPGCGAEVPKRHQFCHDCGKKRAKERAREAMARKRSVV